MNNKIFGTVSCPPCSYGRTATVYKLLNIFNNIFFFLVYKENCINQLKALAVNDPVKCPNNCGRSYKGSCRRHSLKRHLRFECGKLPQFQCMVCFKRFTNKKNMQYHLAAIHKIINH